MNPTRDRAPRRALIAATLLACAAFVPALTGCGGQAKPTPVDCNGVTAKIQYNVLAEVGDSAIANFVYDAQVGTQLGIAGPKLVLDKSSYPGSCVSKPVYGTADALPDGLSLDPATGNITGTPTTTGLFTTQVTVTVPGTVGGTFHSGVLAFEVIPKTPSAVTTWADPRFTPDDTGTVTSIGGQLAYVTAGATRSTLDVLYSADDGFNWTAQPHGLAPSNRTGFGLLPTLDGRLLLWGGSGPDPTGPTLPKTDLWRYDGTAWQRLLPDTPFATTAVMFEDADGLYAIDGDAWRSTDDGASWTKVGAAVFGSGTPSAPVARCGVVFNGVPLVLTERAVTGAPPLTSAWTTADGGVTWTEQPLPVTGPAAVFGGVSACTVRGSQLLVYTAGQHTDSRPDLLASPDLVNWEFQARRAEWSGVFPVSGTANLSGRLYFAQNSRVYATPAP